MTRGSLFVFGVDVQFPSCELHFVPLMVLENMPKPKDHLPGQHWVWMRGYSIAEKTDEAVAKEAEELAESLRQAYIGSPLV